MSVVRISMGRFDADHYDTIREKMAESEAVLAPAIRALKGNQSFYAAIDREHGAVVNISVWDTMADAKQLDALKVMLDLAVTFTAAGLRFDRPITNHETLWTL